MNTMFIIWAAVAGTKQISSVLHLTANV